MNIEKLFKMQKELDEHVNMNHPKQPKENRLNKKLIAFLVELSEMLNEKRSIFKFWSNKKDNNKKALIEYVDGIHFLLSIGLEMGATPTRPFTYVLDYNDIESQILEIYYAASGITEFDYHSYERTLELYLGLGQMLGFTWDEIERSYYAKNAINHERQKAGY